MSFLGWLALTGALSLAVGLGSAYLRRLPLTTALLYLATGLALGPLGLDVLRVDVVEAAPWLEHVSEIGVIVSLFVGGLTLRLPVTAPAWRAAFLLAGPVMLLSIGAVALVCHLALGLPVALALLVGAVLAPTDPVLASAVSVENAADEDHMRYGLSGEAGLNDGMAFPFVVFALLWSAHDGAGNWMLEWAGHRLFWAVPAGLVVGYVAGWGCGGLAFGIRHAEQDARAPSDLLAIGVIALSYVGAEAIGAWGFLSAFAAGVGMRQAERDVTRREGPAREATSTSSDPAPAEHGVPAVIGDGDIRHPTDAAGATVAEALSFGRTMGRLFEAALVVLVGVTLTTHWDARGALLAMALLVVSRPAIAWVVLAGAPVTRAQRGLMSWFGIRGIGSVYYLTYALNHDVPPASGAVAVDLTITVVAISILVHGLTGQPLLDRYERRLGRQ